MINAYKQPELKPLFHADREDDDDTVKLQGPGTNADDDDFDLWDARGRDVVPLSLHDSEREYDAESRH